MLKLQSEYFEATTNSAISVVNAIPTGKGVTIAIDLRCSVRVALGMGSTSESKILSKASDPHNLVSRSASYALESLKARLPARTHLDVDVHSDIPAAAGLKSSSAVSVATTKAVFGLFGRSDDSKAILRSSCEASRDSGASITGAYDDASASLLGGLAFTDNSRFRLIRHSKVPQNLGSKVVILVPRKKVLTSSIKREDYLKYRKESLRAFQHALRGDLVSAMLLNSVVQCAALRYPMEPVLQALSEGANVAGVTGKGPAVAAFCNDIGSANKICSGWSKIRGSKVLIASIVQPRRGQSFG